MYPQPEAITENDLSPEFSDDALALEFTSRYKNKLRYCHVWGTWLEWDDTRWKFEKTLRAFDLARTTAREFANAKGDGAAALKIASANKVSAIERLARSDRRHATTVDVWDTDQWLLNTPSGTLNLLTFHKEKHDPNQYITKCTEVSPKEGCPLWCKFLRDITDNDIDLELFLQRIAGYCLTGSTREHAIFFFYGTGGNGKGVFINTLSSILADYAAVAPMETFLASKADRHPTDLAGLRGARLVTSQETEEGRRWAESKIKALTGGDPISARFMRQDFFTYTPNFKLVIAGNYKPGLRGVDEAIKRRFHLVPFTVTIKDRDPDLSQKLKEEWPGILHWMIEGCIQWQKEGLNPPQAVIQATEEYLNDVDILARWLEECCITTEEEKQTMTPSADLWQSWQKWAQSNNEYVGSRRKFSQALERQGYHPEKDEKSARCFKGLALKYIPSQDDYGNYP